MENIKETNNIQDKDAEQIIGKLLRMGVIIASLVVLIGGIYYLMISGIKPMPDYHTFRAEQNELMTLTGIILGSFTFKPVAIIQFGVLLLIITPIMRIIFSLYAFAVERDKLYIVITLIVLSIIFSSMFGGLNI